MKFDVMASDLKLADVQRLARAVEQAGVDGIVFTETSHSAYLASAVTTLAAPIDVLTGIAVAFPRSPMVTAATAWELADASRGRFRLGLGAQVRAHVERRYGSEFDPPGPRLRDYVQAVRACFRAFRGVEPLSHDGPFYKLSLLPDTWSPGPLDVPDPPIDLAAVNPWMLRMTGEIADGVHIHPIATRAYLEQTARPELTAGAAKSGRSIEDLEVIVPTFLIAGDTEEEREPWRQAARMQIAFYGSTPNYSFMFEQIGREDTTPRLREHQKSGDVAAMSAVIDDEILRSIAVEGTWDEVGDLLVERYSGLADRVVSYLDTRRWLRDPQHFVRFAAIAERVREA